MSGFGRHSPAEPDCLKSVGKVFSQACNWLPTQTTLRVAFLCFAFSDRAAQLLIRCLGHTELEVTEAAVVHRLS